MQPNAAWPSPWSSGDPLGSNLCRAVYSIPESRWHKGDLVSCLWNSSLGTWHPEPLKSEHVGFIFKSLAVEDLQNVPSTSWNSVVFCHHSSRETLPPPHYDRAFFCVKLCHSGAGETDGSAVKTAGFLAPTLGIRYPLLPLTVTCTHPYTYTHANVEYVF